MSNLSVQSLPQVVHNSVPVITTELLAELYGTEINNIQQNFKRNSDRFTQGKHYFKVEGSDLKELKNRLTGSQSVAKRARSLILWTERGAARHAKMLETDQAWDVFEKLEDCYFSQKERAPIVDMSQISGRVLFTYENGTLTDAKVVPSGWIVESVDTFVNILESRGFFIIHESERSQFVKENLMKILDVAMLPA
ncbi:ORF6N domain-containing protein [Photorhabdus hindustanensis]|uniref:KilA-N DNA-binding domain-containing protein n=1 Tax=Photorhabdus hindustanensis TaxID=2918802 RepID=A0A2S8PUF8_9GAMM|nr:ORF6N domain-containing protein [Photorhabdus hindustanensis]PQQ22462.1 hypothetical protein C6H66_23490 [Photorhabdus hindustanensis]